MAELVLWLVILLLLVATNVVALRFLGTAVGFARPSFARAAATVVAIALPGSLIAYGTAWLSMRAGLNLYEALLLAAIVFAGVAFFVVIVAFRSRPTEAVLAALVLGGASFTVAALLWVPLRFAYPAYSVPTNAMAPTICGRHFTGACPDCGGRTVVRVPQDQAELDAEGICAKCLQVRPVREVDKRLLVGDRVLVRRLAAPKRWDVVVFRFPENRRTIYVKRLVGLPGESIELKEGGIWIDGNRLTPPPEIAAIRWYLPEYASSTASFAAEGSPTVLRSDEYFVLGDNSPNSFDSRFWGPVPAEDLRGVVAAIYFPPRSARVLPRH